MYTYDTKSLMFLCLTKVFTLLYHVAAQDHSGVHIHVHYTQYEYSSPETGIDWHLLSSLTNSKKPQTFLCQSLSLVGLSTDHGLLAISI